MRAGVLTMLAVSSCLAAMVPAAHAQSRSDTNDAAVAVCETQRSPFFEIRERNREQIRMQVARGVLVGVLGGGLAGGLATQGQSNDTQRTAIIAGAIIGGLAGGIDQYLDAKRQITQDNRELARLIENDARGYASRIDGLVASIRSTGECRRNQIATWEQRLISTRTEFANREAARETALAAAPDDRARRSLERDNRRASQADGRFLDLMDREQAAIQAAIADDRELFDDVLKYFDDDIMAIAEAQARVEGTSTASLRGPAEAYTVEVVPPAIMASASNFGSSSSAFGSSGSAFGAPAAPAAPAGPDPALLAAADPTDGSVPAWQAQVRRGTSVSASNGHQAALVAQRDARAEATAASQTSQARLQVAVARGALINTGGN
jgi:hypothetical protein